MDAKPHLSRVIVPYGIVPVASQKCGRRHGEGELIADLAEWLGAGFPLQRHQFESDSPRQDEIQDTVRVPVPASITQMMAYEISYQPV